MTLPVDSPLAAVAREEKPEKQLPLRELIKEAESMRRAGQIYAPYYVELHKRFALPVAALVFTVMAFPLGIRSHRGGRARAELWDRGRVLHPLHDDGGRSPARPPARGHRGVDPQRHPRDGGPDPPARERRGGAPRVARSLLAGLGQD